MILLGGKNVIQKTLSPSILGLFILQKHFSKRHLLQASFDYYHIINWCSSKDILSVLLFYTE